MKIIQLIIFLSLTVLNSNYGQSNTVILKTDFEGKIEEGTIQNLIEKIEDGHKIRIGWSLDFDKDQKSDLIHWIDANFLSIYKGHVFNQIEPIYRQTPDKETAQIKILNSDMKWTGIIGTNGKLISRYIISDLHLIEDELLKTQLEKRSEISERIVATIWTIKQ